MAPFSSRQQHLACCLLFIASVWAAQVEVGISDSIQPEPNLNSYELGRPFTPAGEANDASFSADTMREFQEFLRDPIDRTPSFQRGMIFHTPEVATHRTRHVPLVDGNDAGVESWSAARTRPFSRPSLMNIHTPEIVEEPMIFVPTPQIAEESLAQGTGEDSSHDVDRSSSNGNEGMGGWNSDQEMPAFEQPLFNSGLIPRRPRSIVHRQNQIRAQSGWRGHWWTRIDMDTDSELPRNVRHRIAGHVLWTPEEDEALLKDLKELNGAMDLCQACETIALRPIFEGRRNKGSLLARYYRICVNNGCFSNDLLWDRLNAGALFIN